MNDERSGAQSLARTMRLVYVLAFVSAIGNPMVLPCFPQIMEEFGLDSMQLGLMISVFALPTVVAVPLTGTVSDRIGRRPMIMFCLLCAVLGSTACMLAPNYPLMLAGRFLQGMSLAPLEPMGSALASDLYEGEERRRCVTRVMTVVFLSVAAAPLAASALLLVAPWRSCFLVGIVLGLAGAACCLRAPLPYSPPRGASLRGYASHLAGALCSKRAALLFSVRLLTAFVLFGAFYAFFPLLLCREIGADSALAGPGFSCYAVAMFLGSFSVPALSRRMPRWMLGIAGGGAETAAMLLLSAATAPWQAFLGAFGVGFGSSIISTTAVACVSLISTPDTRGAVMSMFSTVFRLGQVGAPAAFGLAYAAGACGAVYAAGAAVAALVTVLAALACA